MADYDDLADRAACGELAPLPGTELSGAGAVDTARAALLAATGAGALDDAVTIARGRPRLDAEEPVGPMWRVRATKTLDQDISRLAKRRGVTKSQILREAAAAYVQAS